MIGCEQYEYQLPLIDVDIDSLNIETKDKSSGRFFIKNIGGGTLEGKVLSRCTGLVFNITEWKSNKQEVQFSFDSSIAGLVPGQSLESFFYISSNGGELRVPVVAKLTKMSITTDEGIVIANLQDFYNYAVTHPAQARRVFVDSEFYMLLLALKYKYLEVYESLHKDSNRERALDNFFILSGLKKRTTIKVKKKKIQFLQHANDKELLHGSIEVEKSDEGFIEAQINVCEQAKWMNFYATRLIQSDFKSSHVTNIHFAIDPAKITGSYAYGIATIGDDDNRVEIEYKQAVPVLLNLSRAGYRYDDKGYVEVINNTGKDMRVEVFCQDNYVKFPAKNYLVGGKAEIPFDIKLSAFLSAQLFFRKLPYMHTTIEVRVSTEGFEQKKKLDLVVGEW